MMICLPQNILFLSVLAVQGKFVLSGGSCLDATSITAPSFFDSTVTLDSSVSDFANAGCEIDSQSTSLWYEFTPTTENAIMQSTVTDQSSSTNLAVFAATSSSDCSSLTCLGSEGQFSFTDLEVEWAASIGITYYIVVTANHGTSLNLQIQSIDLASNDECGSAEDLSSSIPTSFSSSNTAAFPSFSDFQCEIEEVDRGLWYSVTPALDSIGSVLLSNQDFRGRIAIFYGSSCGSLSCLSTTTSSQFSDRVLAWHAVVGITYFIFVSGDGFNEHGTFQLDVAMNSANNDACEEAIDVSTGTNPFITFDDNFDAVPAFADVACGIFEGARGLWYRLSTTEARIVTATVADQSFPTILSVYTGSCGSLTCLSATTASSFSDRQISWLAGTGIDYYIFVSGEEFEDDGDFQLTVEILDPPENHVCTGATFLSPLPFTAVESNTNAVASFADLACGVDENTRALWYKYNATSDGIVFAVVSDQSFSTILSLYTGSCSSLSCFLGTSASGFSDRQISWAANANTDYYLLVSGNTFSDDGQFQIDVEAPAPPANSYCVGATGVRSSQLPFTDFSTNAAAFPNFSDLECGIDDSSRGIWYKFVPGGDVIARATVVDQTFSAILSLYTGSCGSLSCLASTSASQFTDRSITWAASQGEEYFIFVAGNGFGESGTFQIDIEMLDRPVNDVCSGASDALTLPYSTFESNEGSFPGFSDGLCEVPDDARIRWYTYTSPVDRILQARVEDQEFSARLSLFSGSCDTSLSCRVSTTTSQFTDRSVFFTADAGAANILAVSGSDFSENGVFGFSIEAFDRPSDDVCSNATIVNSDPFASFDNNQGAFPSFSNAQCEVGPSARGRWYRLSPSSSSVFRSTIDNQNFDAFISIFAGDCDNLRCLGSDGPYEFVSPGLVFPGYVGSSYHMMVHGDDFDAGDYRINVESLPRPNHDRCGGAFPIPTSGEVFDTNTAALPNFESIACGVDSEARALWFSFTPSTTAIYTATVSDYEWEAALSLFSGNCGGLSCVNRESFCWGPLPVFPFIFYCSFSLSFTGVAGTTYYLVVSGNDGFAPDGFFQLSVERTGSAANPNPPIAPADATPPPVTTSASTPAPIITLQPTTSPTTTASNPSPPEITPAPTVQPPSPSTQLPMTPDPVQAPALPDSSPSPVVQSASPTDPPPTPVAQQPSGPSLQSQGAIVEGSGACRPYNWPMFATVLFVLLSALV